MTTPQPVTPPAQPQLPPPPPSQYPARGTNTLAILALVASFVIAPAGIVLGAIALQEIRRTGEEGRGLALAGLWIGIVFCAVILIFVIVWFGFFLWMMSFFSTLSTTLPSSIPNA